MIKKISNWVYGNEQNIVNHSLIEKFNPHTGKIISFIIESNEDDVQKAIDIAYKSFTRWSSYTPIQRGNVLFEWGELIKKNDQHLASIVSKETGKSKKDALAEVGAALAQCKFFAGEGTRLYGRSLTSGMSNKHSHTVRQPIGVAGLIVPANTPLANIAWKVFPALICGNSVVLKASEDAPEIALEMAKISKQAGLPDGVFNVLQGRGDPVGRKIVEDARVSVISFTGSTAVGRWIAETGGKRLARISLELGGKNPLVICDDADLDKAVHWASLSAFSNAGQRCASGSRIIISENIYEEFTAKFVAKVKTLQLGIEDYCDFGPVINIRQHSNILSAIKKAEAEGGTVLCGGTAPKDTNLKCGYYITPTIIENLPIAAELSKEEIFGPVTTLYPFKSLEEALEICNSSEYGLTAAIHTRNVDRAMWFAQHVKAGVVNINIGTFGSEPHMPFGGFGSSGNGTREPGVEALDVYSEIKNISFYVNLDRL